MTRAHNGRARRTNGLGMLIADNLQKSYRSGGQPLAALRNVSFQVEPGETVAIVGPSGSGKTTLLGLLAGLDRPSGGRVLLDGTDMGALSEDDRARLRREKIGFVFQSFQLIPTLTARENVAVPLDLAGRAAARRARTSCWRGWGWAGAGTTIPPSSAAASSSAWPWRAPSSTARPSSSRTNPRATSMPPRASASSN